MKEQRRGSGLRGYLTSYDPNAYPSGETIYDTYAIKEEASRPFSEGSTLEELLK